MSRSRDALGDAVEQVLARHARKHVGVVVGVRRGGEEHFIGRGRRSRDRESPPGADTVFEIGSITKVFTATLLADMALDGLVSLDDPVRFHLPEDIRVPARRGREITLANLASHTSGLPRLPKGLRRKSLGEPRNPYASYTVSDLHAAVSAARVKRGGRVSYSNFGAGLLGHTLALRAGKSYEDLVRERICLPLGLDDTSISIPEHRAVHFATGHNRRGKPVPHWDLPALAGAGALRSTAADMLRFLELQLEPGESRLGRAAGLTQVPRARGGRLSVGLGWLMLPSPRSRSQRLIWHNGGTGGFFSFAGFVRESRTAIVVLTNSARPADKIGFRILEEIA